MNKDTVFFNGLKIHNQTINEIIHDDGNVLANSQFQGIVGLAFVAIAEPNDIPLLDNIKQQHLLEFDIMSFYYGDDPGRSDSIMTLGGIDESLADGDIKYYDIDERAYWSLIADEILVNNKNLNFCPKGCKLLFDTGTSMITAPDFMR